MSKATTRSIMISDITTLTSLLNKTEYNCKVALKHKNRTFRNHKDFTMPDSITYEQTRRYLLNNLIDLKELLNQLELGVKEEVVEPTDELF